MLERLSSLHHQNNLFAFFLNKKSWTRIAPTFFVIFSGLLIYSENIIGIFFDLSASHPKFINLHNFVYAFGTSISPIFLMFGAVLKPFKLSYLVPLYAYLTAIIGNIYLFFNYDIINIWWYRIMILTITIVIYFILQRTINYYRAISVADELKDKVIKTLKNNNPNVK